MATTIVKYIPKNTGANTEYREISEDDKQMILTRCIKALSVMAEYDTYSQTDHEDQAWCRDNWWHRRSKKLSKGQRGINSPCSVVGGIIHNFMFKESPQYDLSARQMEDLEFVLAGINLFDNSIEPIRFQIGWDNE